jgi:deoxyadenosine/deoxycytidine kinase
LTLVEKYFRAEVGLECRVLTETPDPEMLKLFYSDMGRYAFAMQVDMLRQRQAVNDASTAIAGRSNHYGNSSGRPCVVWNDRSLWGDAVFASVNYKLGNMSDAEFSAYRSILASRGPYKYDRIVFFDVEAKRAHFLSQEHRKKAAEQGIPLAYFEQLRLAYFMQLRAQALTHRAKIIYVYNEPFCEIDHVLKMMIHAPTNSMVAEFFESAPDLKDEATSEEVSAAFARVRKSYEAFYAKK